MQDPTEDFLEGANLDEDTKLLMHEYDLDSDTAERVKELMEDEGLDEDTAVELIEEGL